MADRIVLNTISYHGHGAIENIVPELTARGYKKAFVCSDPDLIKFGVTKKVTDLLDAANFAYAVYSEIKPNPTIANVQDGVAAFKAAEADCIVTIGGGSSMDTAKAIGIIINNPEFADVRSLEGVAPTKKHAVFTIAVPTTAGTAAEVTINYVITDVEKKRKFVCVDTNDIPEIAVVDPDMMSSMPKGLTAATGMDALTHAIEGYITKGHCTISDMFHLEAIKLISENLRGAVQNTPEGREGMALGQYIAGMGFSNVGLGIVHSMAHGLSALYDTPHGVACAILLPVGLEYNKTVAGERYRAVGKAMGVKGIDEMNDAEAADATIAAVKQLSADVGIPANLHGILKEEDIQFLAESAFADACRPGNPRDTSVEEIVELLRDRQDYITMEKVGRRASKMAPFADWESVTMEDLIGMGKYEEARQLYADTVQLYFEERGLKPSQRLMDSLNQLGEQFEHPYEVIDSVKEKLAEPMGRSGPYVCSWPVFQGLYQMVSRMSERNGWSVYLMLCTVVDSKGNPMREGPRLDELSSRLGEAILHSIRRSDMVNRYGKGQYLILLLNITLENCRVVQKRIDGMFLSGRQRTGVKYHVSDVTSER